MALRGSVQEVATAVAPHSFDDPSNVAPVAIQIDPTDAALRPGMRIRMVATGREFEVQTVGTFRPQMTEERSLLAGEVGYVTAGVKTVGDCRVGETRLRFGYGKS